VTTSTLVEEVEGFGVPTRLHESHSFCSKHLIHAFTAYSFYFLFFIYIFVLFFIFLNIFTAVIFCLSFPSLPQTQKGNSSNHPGTKKQNDYKHQLNKPITILESSDNRQVKKPNKPFHRVFREVSTSCSINGTSKQIPPPSPKEILYSIERCRLPV
jgi:hypothetical protein